MANPDIAVSQGPAKQPGEGILLPDAVRQQIARERSQGPQQPMLPPETVKEVKKMLPAARAVNDALAAIGEGDAAIVALSTQPLVRQLLLSHLTGILPSLCQEICRRDRVAVHQVMTQVTEDRRAKTLLAKERLDMPSYAQAVSDLYSVIGQVPIPLLQLAVQAPLMPDEEPTTTEPAKEASEAVPTEAE